MAEQLAEPVMTEAERDALLRELAMCFARAAVDEMLREPEPQEIKSETAPLTRAP